MPDFTTHATPNPNSLKFTVDDDISFIADGMESFNTAQEAADHPLGHRLFAVQGVENVFIMPDFVTVTKHPASDWNVLEPQLQQALSTYFEEHA
ncbi:MAG: scaffolding protein [Bacteroidetes bacterium]|jgi:hypothetical protein|nr:scaffolding protein [Bacteroidota bacterium]